MEHHKSLANGLGGILPCREIYNVAEVGQASGYGKLNRALLDFSTQTVTGTGQFFRPTFKHEIMLVDTINSKRVHEWLHNPLAGQL